MNQWPKFAFFDKKVLKTENGEPADFLKPYKIFASTSGRGKIIIGDANGFITIFDQSWMSNSFRAYMLRVTHLFLTKQQNILVSIGDDEETSGPHMKVWNLDKVDQATQTPQCSRMIQLSSKQSPDLVTCFAVHENLNCFAVGFGSGAVLLYRGDITKERGSAKPVFVHEGKNPITGLQFRPTTSSKGGIVLYMSTFDEIWSCMLGTREKENMILLDSHGCARNCATIADTSVDFQFVVGRSDAFYFYMPDNRGPCLAFGGEKVYLDWALGYLIVVSKREDDAPKGLIGDMQIITIYDVKNKLIAYYGPIPEVRAVVSEWNSLYIICDDNKIFELREKELSQKLEMLFKKNMYSLAISLGKAQQFDQEFLIDMYRLYGDRLYKEGNFDEAMLQYIKTIGKLEPSYVIRKFLDAQRINNLTTYLKALHEQSLATEDHTTLLLNCYTKLKNVEELDKFIMSKNPNHSVNVETAIRVLRQSGYFRHALFLSEQHQQHDWYMKIQLEDVKDYQGALDYISKLDNEECENLLKLHGKILITNIPKETTHLVQRICTSPKLVSRMEEVDETPFGPEETYPDPESFFHIFSTNPIELMQFLEAVVEHHQCTTEAHHSLLTLYLEAIKKSSNKEERTDLERKAMKLLRESSYDVTTALLACQMADFTAGVLYLYELKKMYPEMLQYSFNRKAFEQAVDVCRRFGDQDGHLWVQTFWFLAKSFGECEKKLLQEVLIVIEQRHLIPPLLVVDILSKNPIATLDLIRDYIIRRMQQDERRIKEDEAQVRAFNEKTQKVRSLVDELKTQPITFQDVNCSACGKSLELPYVSFLCKHTFHQHCYDSYSESDECPMCKWENRKLREQIRSLEQEQDFSTQFFSRINRETDSFSVVAEFFGKGMFGSQVSIHDLVKTQPNAQNS